MKTRNFALAFSALALAAASFAANAGIVFTSLGNVAPPASIGGHALTPFNQAPQSAISEFASVSVIPGGPSGTTLGISPAATKFTRGLSWNGSPWAGGYNGVLYFSNYYGSTETLTLPAGTEAFYFYVESNYYSTTFTYTATTDSGATSTPIAVAGGGGGSGFAFHSTAGESITSITITGDGLNEGGFVTGQFGINSTAITCASEGYKGAQLTWCKNICENGLTGQVLDTWIHRWIDRYRQLPYCAVVTPPPVS